MSTIAKVSFVEYERMAEAGIFNGPNRRRIELIRGELRDMSPIGGDHCALVDKLALWSFKSVPEDEIRVRVQAPIGIPALESEPEPDLVWAAGKIYHSGVGHPRPKDILLVIEVADSSLTYDRGEKAEIYAEANIREYWVVDVVAQSVFVSREPKDGLYRDVHTFVPGQKLSPLALPTAELDLQWLFDKTGKIRRTSN